MENATVLARTDQEAIAVREMTKIIGSYRRGLVEQGIPEEQANELVNAYAESYWTNAHHRCCTCGEDPTLLG